MNKLVKKWEKLGLLKNLKGGANKKIHDLIKADEKQIVPKI